MDVLIHFLTIMFAAMIVNVTSAIAAINPLIFGYRFINEYGLIRKALRYWTPHNLLRQTDQFPSKVLSFLHVYVF
jgi:hypothetical protein